MPCCLVGMFTDEANGYDDGSDSRRCTRYFLALRIAPARVSNHLREPRTSFDWACPLFRGDLLAAQDAELAREHVEPVDARGVGQHGGQFVGAQEVARRQRGGRAGSSLPRCPEHLSLPGGCSEPFAPNVSSTPLSIKPGCSGLSCKSAVGQGSGPAEASTFRLCADVPGAVMWSAFFVHVRCGVHPSLPYDR